MPAPSAPHLTEHDTISMHPDMAAAVGKSPDSALDPVRTVRGTRVRRHVRVAVAGLVTLTGLANLATALWPHIFVALRLVEQRGHLHLLLTGRVAAAELGVVLLVTARSLLRGSATAWAVATLAAALAAAVELAHARVSAGGIASVVLLVVLLSLRWVFPLHTTSRSWRALVLPASMAAGLVAWALAGYAELEERHPAALSARVDQIMRTTLLLPDGVPGRQLGVEAYAASLRVGLIAILIVTIAVLARQRRAGGSGADRDRVRIFVEANGTSSTSPMLALPTATLIGLCGGQAMAGIAVRNGIAVSLGAPVAVAGQEQRALAEFTTYCERLGWAPALLAVDDKQRVVAESLGFHAERIGVEAVIDVATFSTAGKPRANIRHSVSRAHREDVSVLRYDGPHVTQRRTAQLGAVSAAWVDGKGGTELGFTLGTFDPARLADQEVYVAVTGRDTPAEQVVAFVTWLPYAAGKAAVLDLMRRGTPCPPGVMETLIVDSITDFATRGRAVASLGGVPLADTEPRIGRLQRAMGWLFEHGGRVYEARGLFAFKNKFVPQWEPIYLAVPSVTDLPRAGLAAARAFLPDDAVRQLLPNRRRLSRERSAEAAAPVPRTS